MTDNDQSKPWVSLADALTMKEPISDEASDAFDAILEEIREQSRRKLPREIELDD
ncbi:hypothetical protein [Tsukamurella pseudospumae]|uniref:hypothetical protein n=1 Tax=Tsukamurella pseudospumae TaxID=239498 RepID=UPI000AF91DC7|nr:hypothetical protein [Tsukamurella pseudospumae]